SIQSIAGWGGVEQFPGSSYSWVLLETTRPEPCPSRFAAAARTMDLGVVRTWRKREEIGESEKKKKRLRSASSVDGERSRPGTEAVSSIRHCAPVSCAA